MRRLSDSPKLRMSLCTQVAQTAQAARHVPCILGNGKLTSGPARSVHSYSEQVCCCLVSIPIQGHKTVRPPLDRPVRVRRTPVI